MKAVKMKKVIIPVLIALAVSGCDTNKLDLSNLNPEQKEQLGQITSDYLINHPEFLIHASDKLNQQKQIALDKQSIETAKVMAKQLTQDVNTPFIGPKDAQVSVIEFFDYQCVFCTKIAPEVKQLIEDNADVKFVFKETPIFSGRWEASEYAAQMGLWVFKQKGSKAYAIFHDNVFATGKNEGKLTEIDINTQAEKAGVVIADFKLNEQGSNSIKANFQLFSNLGFQGTPALIVMPSVNPTINNIKVIKGFDPTGLKVAIDEVRSNIP